MLESIAHLIQWSALLDLHFTFHWMSWNTQWTEWGKSVKLHISMKMKTDLPQVMSLRMSSSACKHLQQGCNVTVYIFEDIAKLHSTSQRMCLCLCWHLSKRQASNRLTKWLKLTKRLKKHSSVCMWGCPIISLMLCFAALLCSIFLKWILCMIIWSTQGPVMLWHIWILRKILVKQLMCVFPSSSCHFANFGLEEVDV